MAEQKATNVHWHDGEISRQDRQRMLGQKGATVWFTGLSGSGKSTVAVALEKALAEQGKLTYRLDGDNIRMGINKNLGLSLKIAPKTFAVSVKSQSCSSIPVLSPYQALLALIAPIVI
jgi:Mrp family chromosome partitioning ATPase